jgi:glutathione synthase
MNIENGIMKVNGKEISLVYYRSGYTPSDYPSPLQWNVRKDIECSRAIKVILYSYNSF